MSLTLKSLQTEMRSSFAEVNERTDHILIRLDAHIKETDFRFREVDRRFDKVDQRFDQMDRKFDKFIGDVIASFSSYSSNIEKMLHNHEDRITMLENKH